MIAHPADPRRATRRVARFVPGDRGIEIAAMVEQAPFALGRKGHAVERTDHADRARSGAVVEQVDLEQPAAGGFALDRELDQQRALPQAPLPVMGPDSRQARPLPEVGRAIDRRQILGRQGDDHDPLGARRMPEDIGITKVGEPFVEHRIIGIFGPCPAVVIAVRKALHLPRPVVRRASVGGDQCPLAEPRRAVFVDHGRARKDEMLVILEQGGGQFIPRREVAADGMAPRHVPPLLAMRIILVEQVPLAIGEDQPVGVAQPVGGGRIMIERAHRNLMRRSDARYSRRGSAWSRQRAPRRRRVARQRRGFSRPRRHNRAADRAVRAD